MSAVVAKGAVVPSLWPLEVVNDLLVAERKKRLTGTQATMFLERLLALPVEIEGTPSGETWPRLHSLARTYSLSSYDTAYLELAARRGIPLASCDKALRQGVRDSVHWRPPRENVCTGKRTEKDGTYQRFPADTRLR